MIATNALAAVITAPRTVEVREVEVPATGPGEVQVTTLFSGISAGTEMNVARTRTHAHDRHREEPYVFEGSGGPLKTRAPDAKVCTAVKVVVVMPSSIEDAADFLANVRALDAAGAKALVLEAKEPDVWVLAGAVAAVTHRVGIALAGATAVETLDALSRGRLLKEDLDGVAWVRVELPPTRAEWAQVLEDQAAAGATGIVVSWDPRLIDLLRNPEPDDRSDLLMSTG
jgi:hypothetical protein